MKIQFMKYATRSFYYLFLFSLSIFTSAYLLPTEYPTAEADGPLQDPGRKQILLRRHRQLHLLEARLAGFYPRLKTFAHFVCWGPNEILSELGFHRRHADIKCSFGVTSFRNILNVVIDKC